MSNDYLFDKRGAPDPEVERLEKLLARYRYEPRPLQALEVQRVRTFRRFAWIAAVAALLVMIAIAIWLQGRHGETVRETIATVPYRVEGLTGVDSVSTGQSLTTGAEQRARMEIGSIGHLDVAPNSSVRVVDSAAGHHDLFLERGSVHAKILAQPRVFQIGTPAGRSIDLGCEYSLDVSARGESVLRVTTGQVAFEFDGREIYVPAHARCTSAPGRGPSAPVFENTSPQFRDALAAVEFDANPPPGAIQKLVDAAEREDSLSLWHLFDTQKTAPALRDAAFRTLVKGFPPPDGTTEAGLRSGDTTMRARWLETMKPAWRTAM